MTANDEDLIETAVKKALREFFLTLGIDTDDPKAVVRLQRNIAFLQALHTGAFGLGWTAAMAIVVAVIGGMLSALWLGIRTIFNTH